MIYEFEITSEEKEDFSMMIKIKEDQTFLEFHEKIQSSIGYDDSQLASFYTLDSLGTKNKEVSLFEMEDEESNIETYVMDVTMIREIVGESSKTLLYVFDFFGDRSFAINLVGTERKRKIDYPACTLLKGEAPVQINADADLFTDDELKAPKKADDDYLNDPYLMEMDEASDVKFESLDDYQDIL
jgi:hypothetical protein